MDSSKRVAYRRIAADLRNQILTGELSEGDKLPSVANLRQRYAVNVATVVRALDSLKAEGYVIARQGSGVYVRTFQAIKRSSPSRVAHERWSSGHSIQDADSDDRPRAVDVVVKTIEAPEWVTEALEVRPETPIVSRHWRFLVDDRPVQVATSYYIAEMVRGSRIMETSSGPGGSFARLEELGHAPDRFTEYLRARMPLPEESEALELSEGTPVLEITRHAFTVEDRCVNVNRMVLDATAYQLDYSFPA